MQTLLEDEPIHQAWVVDVLGDAYTLGDGARSLLLKCLTAASESVAIEIETGKSDAVRNVQQDLLAGCSAVLVVAVDRTALAKVERELEAAGLLLPQVCLKLATSDGQTKAD